MDSRLRGNDKVILRTTTGLRCATLCAAALYSSPMPSRRIFLAAASSFALTSQPLRLLAQLRFQKNPFTLGVASGYPLPDGIVLWTRLAPYPLTGGGMPDVAVEVIWEIADNESVSPV